MYFITIMHSYVIKQVYECICVFARFNFFKTAGSTNIKLGTIDHGFGIRVIRGWWRYHNFFFNLHFLTE